MELFSISHFEVICNLMQYFLVTLLWVNIQLDIRVDRKINNNNNNNNNNVKI